MFVIKFQWMKGEDHLKDFLKIHSKYTMCHLVAVKACDTIITAVWYIATNCNDSGVTSGFRCATIQK